MNIIIRSVNMKYCIGVDLGGTNIAVGLVELEKREIVNKVTRKTNAPRSCEAISTDIAEMCRELCRAQRIGMSDVSWVGIATPGVVKDGVVVAATNLGWSNVNFAEIAERLTERPIFVANDANAAAYAEAVWGAGAGESSLIAITLGTGVGGGIIVNGKIFTGFNFAGAEIGHIVIETDGALCGCGRRGCWEAYSSATALIRMTKEKLAECEAEGRYTSMSKAERISGRTACDAMRQGDAAGKEVYDKYVKYLAAGLTNMINIFQPQVISLGGGVSNEGQSLIDALLPIIRAEQYGAAFLDKSELTEIRIAKLGNDAGIIGAAALA